MKTQQTAVYRAEAGALTGTVFTSLDELEAWVHEKMLDTPWWRERFPKVRGIYIPRVDRKGDGSVGTWYEEDWTGHIEMSPVHWCAKYVCHEIAHVTSAAHAGSRAHDPAFVRDYLELVYRTMGTDPWIDLRQRFLDAGIVIDPRDAT